MFIAGFPAGPWGTNCYVVATGPGSECVVIDPGIFFRMTTVITLVGGTVFLMWLG